MKVSYVNETLLSIISYSALQPAVIYCQVLGSKQMVQLGALPTAKPY
jgi:hypothetical protein